MEQGLLQQLGAVAEEFPSLPAIAPVGRQLAQMGAQGVLAAGDALHGHRSSP